MVLLVTSGLQGVVVWQFLLCYGMSSGDMRLQISPDFLRDQIFFCHLTIFHQKKRAALQIPLKEGIVGEREGDFADNYIGCLYDSQIPKC
jgi:hypothetical protein